MLNRLMDNKNFDSESSDEEERKSARGSKKGDNQGSGNIVQEIVKCLVITETYDHLKSLHKPIIDEIS